MYHGFTIDLLVELVRSGLATAQAERVAVRFFDLRGEVVRRLTEFANVRAKWKEFPYEPATDGPHDKEEQARLTSLPKNAANRGGLSQRTTVRFGDLLEPRPVKRRRVAGPDHARRP